MAAVEMLTHMNGAAVGFMKRCIGNEVLARVLFGVVIGVNCHEFRIVVSSPTGRVGARPTS